MNFYTSKDTIKSKKKTKPSKSCLLSKKGSWPENIKNPCKNKKKTDNSIKNQQETWIDISQKKDTHEIDIWQKKIHMNRLLSIITHQGNTN